MDFKEIQDLIKMVKKYGLKKVHIQDKDFKINIVGQSDGKIISSHTTTPFVTNIAPQAPLAVPPVHQQEPVPETSASPEENGAGGDDNIIAFKSPMIGTFYRRPSPDKEPYIKVGEPIEPGKVVCVIEAMKLFNDIECDISGKVVKILVEDASPVEYDQDLFLVDTSA
jgi:acetyl-CoA carboxylase biotin carboxyl carrier protein